MLELPLRKSDVASIPPHPGAFRLTGPAFPLAGLDDTYWMARAIWVDGQRDDEGFLIYADTRHYLFLDEEEARNAAFLLTEIASLRPARTPHSRADMLFSDTLHGRLLVRLLALSGKMRLLLTLGTLLLSLGLYALFFPSPLPGILLIVPIALAGWYSGWRGVLAMLGSVVLLLGSGYLWVFGGAFWSSAWLVPGGVALFCCGCTGLLCSALRVIAERLLATRTHTDGLPRVYEQGRDLGQAGRQISSQAQEPLAHMRKSLELLAREQLAEEREGQNQDTSDELAAVDCYFAFTMTRMPTREAQPLEQTEVLASD